MRLANIQNLNPELSFDVVFDFDKYHYILGVNKNILRCLKSWWYNRSKNTGILRGKLGHEILNKCGCLIRFLLAIQDTVNKSEFL